MKSKFFLPKTGLIYLYRCKTTNEHYVGQTKEIHLQKRKAGGYSAKFQKAIHKYGWDDFETIILERSVPYELLDEREYYWIEYYDSFKNGLNSTPGGNVYNPLPPSKALSLIYEAKRNRMKDKLYKIITDIFNISYEKFVKDGETDILSFLEYVETEIKLKKSALKHDSNKSNRISP